MSTYSPALRPDGWLRNAYDPDDEDYGEVYSEIYSRFMPATWVWVAKRRTTGEYHIVDGSAELAMEPDITDATFTDVEEALIVAVALDKILKPAGPY